MFIFLKLTIVLNSSNISEKFFVIFSDSKNFNFLLNITNNFNKILFCMELFGIETLNKLKSQNFVSERYKWQKTFIQKRFLNYF